MPANKSKINLLVVLGPTASGKTRLGARLARLWGGEIVSADSRQVYRGLDIGSGKDLDEYVVDGVAVPYHLIDIADLDQEYSVFNYQKDFYQVFEQISARGVLPVVVGGTGLYLEAVLRQYRMVEVPENPQLRAELALESDEQLIRRLHALKDRLHNITDLETRERLVRAIEIAQYSATHEPLPAPDIRPLILGTQWERPMLRRRIYARLNERLQNGMVAEVEGLYARGVPWERLERLGLEYRFISEYIQGKIRSRSELVQQLGAAISQFAKRQDSWYRRMERNGVEILWVPQGDFETAAAMVEEPLKNSGYRHVH